MPYRVLVLLVSVEFTTAYYLRLNQPVYLPYQRKLFGPAPVINDPAADPRNVYEDDYLPVDDQPEQQNQVTYLVRRPTWIGGTFQKQQEPNEIPLTPGQVQGGYIPVGNQQSGFIPGDAQRQGQPPQLAQNPTQYQVQKQGQTQPVGQADYYPASGQQQGQPVQQQQSQGGLNNAAQGQQGQVGYQGGAQGQKQGQYQDQGQGGYNQAQQPGQAQGQQQAQMQGQQQAQPQQQQQQQQQQQLQQQQPQQDQSGYPVGGVQGQKQNEPYGGYAPTGNQQQQGQATYSPNPSMPISQKQAGTPVQAPRTWYQSSSGQLAEPQQYYMDEQESYYPANQRQQSQVVRYYPPYQSQANLNQRAVGRVAYRPSLYQTQPDLYSPYQRTQGQVIYNPDYQRYFPNNQRTLGYVTNQRQNSLAYFPGYQGQQDLGAYYLTRGKPGDDENLYFETQKQKEEYEKLKDEKEILDAEITQLQQQIKDEVAEIVKPENHPSNIRPPGPVQGQIQDQSIQEIMSQLKPTAGDSKPQRIYYAPTAYLPYADPLRANNNNYRYF